MSCMLPTATLRCACCAAFILPNITALLLLAGCSSSQWQRRITAIARHHKAVAWLSPPARSCTAASRCARVSATSPLWFARRPASPVSAHRSASLCAGAMSYIASAPQVSVSHDSTTLRRSFGSACLQQRSRAGRTAWCSWQWWHSHATGTGFAAHRVYIGCCFVK